ncbi:MAG: hypothetical protein JWQ11_2733 [Rhizobacter sp.]|nr:hypothetical protein [Rhizobacter sp.]
MNDAMETPTDTFELPLFPLQSVLFPEGLLGLKVFEARYVDLMSSCMRRNSAFGVVALVAGSEVKRHEETEITFEHVGVCAELIDVDAEQSGILVVKCKGTRRFTVHSSTQMPDGLWVARASFLPDDETVELTDADTLQRTARGLESAVATLKEQGAEPFLEPFHFDNAGWVANRWCEILPISQSAKQKLMELPDATVRLQLVDEFLSSRGVVQ